MRLTEELKVMNMDISRSYMCVSYISRNKL